MATGRKASIWKTTRGKKQCSVLWHCTLNKIPADQAPHCTFATFCLGSFPNASPNSRRSWEHNQFESIDCNKRYEFDAHVQCTCRTKDRRAQCLRHHTATCTTWSRRSRSGLCFHQEAHLQLHSRVTLSPRVSRWLHR